MYVWTDFCVVLFVPLNYVDCPDVSIPNGVVDAEFELTTQKTISIKCGNCYTIKGSSINHCKNGRWLYPQPSCKGMQLCLHTDIIKG